MLPRRRRLLLIGFVLLGITVSAGFSLLAFQENLTYFYSPTQVVEGEVPGERRFRLGGMVVKDSITRSEGSLTVNFAVTDFAHAVPVEYTGLLPDLFMEEQSAVARGRLDPSGRFVAEEVLAKHDENYMSPEVAEALELANDRTAP